MSNRVIGGVASGLADYFGIDVVLVRVLFVAAFFLPFHFHIVLFYVIAWIIIPKKPVDQKDNNLIELKG